MELRLVTNARGAFLALEAKFRTVKLAVEEANSKGRTRVQVVMDAQMVERVLNHFIDCHEWWCQNLVEEIWNVRSTIFSSFSLKWIPRSKNVSAHNLCNWALSTKSSGEFSL